MDALLERGPEILAPDILPYELGQAVRRAKGTPAARGAMLSRVAQVIQLVRPTTDERIAALADAEEAGLSFYDASYVRLARSRGIPLWTEDRQILTRCSDVARSSKQILASLGRA